jgi:hypothetical protein
MAERVPQIKTEAAKVRIAILNTIISDAWRVVGENMYDMSDVKNKLKNRSWRKKICMTCRICLPW